MIAKTMVLSTLVAGICLCAVPVMAQHGDHGDNKNASQPLASRVINTTCPISGEDLDEDAQVVMHKGNMIGLCCKKCRGKWNDMNMEDRDAIVVALSEAQPSGDHGKMDHDAGNGHAADDKRKGDFYTLNTCPISGGELGGMGDPVVKVYHGREVRFCCAGCIKKFESSMAENWKKIDKQIIKTQLPYYPVDTCIVSGEAFGGDEMGEPINYVHNNRLVRFCCKGCIKKFEADAEAFMEKLDAAVIAQQVKDYPLDTCLVGGGKLGSMGKPVQIVSGNRLVQFCCKGCWPEFEKDTNKFIATLDKAWGHKVGNADEGSHGGGGHKGDH